MTTRFVAGTKDPSTARACTGSRPSGSIEGRRAFSVERARQAQRELHRADGDADNCTMPRLTLLPCENCRRLKAHAVERIDGLLTWTCTRCGSVVKQSPARRTG